MGAVGIDLGTSNSVVSWEDGGGQVHVLADKQRVTIQPSIVAFTDDPGNSVVVGSEAKQRRITDPRNTIYSFKRLMGQTAGSVAVRQIRARVPYKIHEAIESDDMPSVRTRAGEFSAVELSAIMLDHLRDIATTRLRRPVDSAVITVPASFNDAQRSATASAAAIAGLKTANILNEPTAAALAYGATRSLDEIIAVFDFGGGTFDLTVMKLENQTYTVLGTAGDSFLGGDDIDERIVELMLARVIADHKVDLRDDIFAMMKLRAAAEEIKIALSTKQLATIAVHDLAIGAKGEPITLELTLSHAELVAVMQDLVDRAMSVTRDALSVASMKLDRISDVILVGGTTRIPYIRHRVASLFERAARRDVSPQEAVSIGAALYATSLTQARTFGVGFDIPQPETQANRALPSTTAPPQHIVDIDEALADVETKIVSIDEALDEIDFVPAVPRVVTPQPGPPRRVVIDVTPNSLGVATVSGYCEILIQRSSPLPIVVRKNYATLRDHQDVVRIVVCQGETRRLAENVVLGDVVLEELPRKPRGEVEIEVAFELDTSGMLQVSARDAASGQSRQVSLDLVGRMSDTEVSIARERMQRLRLG